MQFWSSYKRKMSPALYKSCFIIMEDGTKIRLQYALSMAFVYHHVQAVNIYQFVRTQFRWKRGQRRRGFWTRPWILRRRQFGLYDQLPPLVAVPRRQPIRCQPSDLVPCCRAPSRNRRSSLKQRPILFARLRSLPQPFVPCRRVVAEGRFHPSANLAFSPLAVALPPQFSDFHIRLLSSVICRYYVSPPLANINVSIN